MIKRGLGNSQAGFTITELSLAMSMLAMMIVVLIASTIQFTNIFNKGITLKRVNQSGRNIGSDLQNNLRRADSNSLNRRLNDTSNGTTYTTGVCTGQFSYVWNVTSPTNGSTSIEYDDGQPVYFAKVNDSSGQMCTDPNLAVPRAASSELLGDGLIVRDPTGVAFAPSSSGSLISVTFTISTDANADIDDTTGRSKCAAVVKNDFCALNTFLITAFANSV